MPRLWHSNRAVPISASSAFTRWVTLDCTVLSSSAAHVISRSARDSRKGQEIGQFHGVNLRFILQMVAFLKYSFLRMIVRPSLLVQSGRNRMPIATPLTALSGVAHAIVSAPMDTIAGTRLAGRLARPAVLASSAAAMVTARLEAETAKLKDFSVPFGIGFITWSLARKPELLDIALEPIRARSCCRSAIPRPLRRRSSLRVRC